jgi:hypothetical protein
MTLRSALLSYRIQRFETTIIVGAAILSVAVSAAVIALFTTGGYAQCFGGDGPVLTSLCQSPTANWLNRIARLSASIVPIFPLVAGLLAGGPIVARELESGTARLAWSLGPSRARWFGQRALPILVMVALAGLAIGLTANALLTILQPGIDLGHSFVGFRWRGPLVAVEALLVASIALAVGAILGRMVPTIVLSLILILGLTIAVDKVERTTLLSEAVISDGQSFSWSDTNLNLESRVKFPDGQILTYEEAFLTRPEMNEPWTDQPPYQDVVFYVPGSRYHEVELREGLALAVLTLGFVGLGGLAVVRRRPR